MRKITFFALAVGKCLCCGASGSVFSSAARSVVKATLPSEAPSEQIRSRRVGACNAGVPTDENNGLVDIGKLVGIEKHEADIGEGTRVGVTVGGLKIRYEVSVRVEFFAE